MPDPIDAKALIEAAVQTAERRAAALRLRIEGPFKPDAGEIHDHRTDVAGDLADALDKLQPELGSRFMAAVFAEVQMHGVPA